MEIKQKDADIQNDGQERFGWDAHRLALYLYIMHHTSFGGRYVISEIGDREERNHLQWLYISIEHMLQNLNWGGVRSGTLMLPKSSFTRLNMWLTEISRRRRVDSVYLNQDICESSAALISKERNSTIQIKLLSLSLKSPNIRLLL